MKENLIQQKSFDFALSIIELYKMLIERKEYIISKQIFRSGTSIGANIEESIGAQSKMISFPKYLFLIKKQEKLNIG